MKSPKVFTDFHHASLLNSLIMLFEGRLGGEVYRPIGMDWATYGFWKVYDHPETQAQYLSMAQGYNPVDGTPPLNLIEEVKQLPEFNVDVHYCRDIDSDQLNKAITFDAFCKMDIDIVIASIPEHIEPFKKLIAQFKPNAKLIFQVGNQWTPVHVSNVMASAQVDLSDVPNSVIYHQEFDLDIFKPSNIYLGTTISSYINVLQDTADYHKFLALEEAMPDWTFRSYGGQCRNGSLGGAAKLAEDMQMTQFIWHVKPGGDGYGHVLFNSAAVGKPVIVDKSYYVGKLGEKLLIDGVTCIDIQNKASLQVVSDIEKYSETNTYAQMCKNVVENFKEQVNFDEDFEKIKIFLEELI